MLMENTGIAMMDSGGDEGRMWQRNAKRDIKKDNAVMLDYEAPCASSDVDITISLYHYLPTMLELDDLCDEYNALPQKDWDGEAYGVSERGEEWLKAHGFSYGTTWNSYNGECNLSQTLQATELKRDGLGEGDYVLLQVHGGADVRGGYTDAKLFKYQSFQEMIDVCPRVYATCTKQDGTTIELESQDSGYGLVTVDGGESITIEKGDIVEADI